MKLLPLLLFCITFSNGARILGVFNHPGPSHTFLGKILLKTLSQRGHEVVMISSFPMIEKIPNYKDIVLSRNLDDIARRRTTNENKAMSLQELMNMTLQHTEYTFTEIQVQNLLASNETFDVIIMDWFYNEATLIFSHIFKAPVIYSSSFGNMFLLNDFTGNVLPYSYVPGAGLLISDDISFKYRVLMTLINVANNLFIPRRYNAHYELLKRHFENPPTIQELQENVALVLSTSHFSIETSRPYTPNIIPVAGLHIEEPKKLPQELQTFLDSAKEGVILFSLGSQIKSSDFGEGVLSSIVKALGKLPQKVLWKYEMDDMSDIPENIKVMKWLPQTDILAHSKLKLFITHGGVLSLIESIHYHVPLICIPFNGDQLTNAAFVESRGIGLYILPNNITENNLFQSIKEVIKSPKYQKQTNYYSSLLRDQPVKPLDAAVYWTEHVIKYGHANHLKPFATKLPWYKYYLIDVIGFLVLVVFIIIRILYWILKYSISKMHSFIVKTKKTKSE